MFHPLNVKHLFSSFALVTSQPDQNTRLPNEFTEFDSLFIQLHYFSDQLLKQFTFNSVSYQSSSLRI